MRAFLAAKEVLKKDKIARPAAGKFTTQYAVDYGRKLGWTAVERERFDFRTKRHHDVAGCADVLFRDGARLILVQGAGLHERSTHRAKFDQHQSAVAGRAFVYWEFIKGQKSPVFEEWWAK